MAIVILTVALSHWAVHVPSEPFFTHDEVTHMTTSVFFRDLILDMPLTDLREHTFRYFMQYPELGLVVWPPLFHVIAGLFMLVFGTSITVAKILVCLFSIMACVYLFKLVERTHGIATAPVAAIILGLSPLVFGFSHQVMLEVPALAWSMMAIYHFHSYLQVEKVRDLFLASLAAAFAVLTRFDGAYLAPLLLVLIIVYRRMGVLKNKGVYCCAAFAMCLVIPQFMLTGSEFGWKHGIDVTQHTGSATQLLFKRLLFYPSCLSAQMSWWAIVPLLIGLISAFHPSKRKATRLYLAIIAVVYVMFTAVVELLPRHTIYWIPAFSLFAADGITTIVQAIRQKWLRSIMTFSIPVAMLWSLLATPLPYLRGFEETARYIIANSTTSNVVFSDIHFNGSLIYYVHRNDPQRRFWTLRADKLLYGSAAYVGYTEHVEGEEGIAAKIYQYDPQFIVVDEPRYHPYPMNDQLRSMLRSHPAWFRLEAQFDIETNQDAYKNTKILVYKNLRRNRQPDHQLVYPLRGMNKTIAATIPPPPDSSIQP